MQLQFAYILQQMLPLVIFKKSEKVVIELETTVFDGSNYREADVIVTARENESEYKIAIELKCYKKLASSGGNRGASDIFMKDVYQDLNYLENYYREKKADYGIGLVMTDFKKIVHPEKKQGKCWIYDTSCGSLTKIGYYSTPIGGKSVNINLEKQYLFDWNQVNDYYFVLLENKNPKYK